MILRIARLVPARGHESTVTDHLRRVMDAASDVPGLVFAATARELDGERQVLFVVTCWASPEALAAYVVGDLAALALPPEIAAIVEEATVTHAEGVGAVWGRAGA